MAGKIGTVDIYCEGTGISLSPEDTVLVHCARLDFSHQHYQTIKDILTEGINWDLLIKKADWHRLSPLVAYHLKSSDLANSVPKPVLDRMQSLYYQSLARNLVLQDELLRLLTVFNEYDIPVIVLKGAAISEVVYGDVSLRPIGDLDILVQPRHVGQVEAIVCKLGYGFLVSPKIQELTRKNCRHLANLWHHKKRIILEIHQHIASPDEPYYFNLNDFWARARPFTISSAHALTLAPEDLLIHLSIKFLLDRRYQSNSALGQICDISEVIRHYSGSFDWDLIEKTARENGLSKGLYFVLYTCRQLLQTQLSAVVMERFQPREFSTTSAEMFIRRRVLDSRPWLAHGLVDSRVTFSYRSVIRAIAGRLSNFTRSIINTDRNDNGDGLFNFRKAGNILPRLTRVLFRPAELKEDLQLDRWLHDLYQTN